MVACMCGSEVMQGKTLVMRHSSFPSSPSFSDFVCVDSGYHAILNKAVCFLNTVYAVLDENWSIETGRPSSMDPRSRTAGAEAESTCSHGWETGTEAEREPGTEPDDRSDTEADEETGTVAEVGPSVEADKEPDAEAVEELGTAADEEHGTESDEESLVYPHG